MPETESELADPIPPQKGKQSEPDLNCIACAPGKDKLALMDAVQSPQRRPGQIDASIDYQPPFNDINIIIAQRRICANAVLAKILGSILDSI